MLPIITDIKARDAEKCGFRPKTTVFIFTKINLDLKFMPKWDLIKVMEMWFSHKPIHSFTTLPHATQGSHLVTVNLGSV